LEFEWDEGKRQQGIEKHGVDMVYAALIFEGPVLTVVDDRMDYGEVREISLGLVEDEVFLVVHTQRGEVTRIISGWKGGRNDRHRYEAGLAGRHPPDEGGG
jgi:uncharacterized DUF497 family protein